MAERSSFDECVGSFLTQNGITLAMLLSDDSIELITIEVNDGVALDLYYFFVKTHIVHFIHSEDM